MKPAPLPPTISTLPQTALIISYDFEGTRGSENYLPGCSMSVGASAFTYPYAELIKADALFRTNIKFKVPMDDVRKNWWAQHPTALAANLHKPITSSQAAQQFVNWLSSIRMKNARFTQIVLMSSPHSYDGQHMADLLAHVGKTKLPPFQFADVGEALSGLTGMPQQEAKSAYKHFLTKQLFHVPDMDSIEQFNAFVRARDALLHKLPIPASNVVPMLKT